MLPQIALLGTWIFVLGLGVLHLCADPQANAEKLRWLQIVNYATLGAIIFHWTMVLTVGIGCFTIMVMKGPGYVADGYNLSHSDKPRATSESDEEILGTYDR